MYSHCEELKCEAVACASGESAYVLVLKTSEHGVQYDKLLLYVTLNVLCIWWNMTKPHSPNEADWLSFWVVKLFVKIVFDCFQGDNVSNFRLYLTK